MMRMLAVLALVSGCATTWGIGQAAGVSLAPLEQRRDVRVPHGGLTEQLRVSIATTPAAPATSTTAATPTTPVTSTTPTTPAPVQITCTTEQLGASTRYTAAFRYGKSWKLATGLMFVAEALVATAFALEARDGKPVDWIGAGYFGADALATAGIFFIPKKSVVETSEEHDALAVATGCPDGLVLAIGGDTFPIDAAGRIGALGDAAYAAFDGPVAVTFGNETRLLARTGATAPSAPSATFEVAEGTLTKL